MCDKPEVTTVMQGNANFTSKLYNILSGDTGNLLFSPLSVHTVLSMVYQGAKGATKDAFSSALSIPDPNVAAKSYRSIMLHVNNIPLVQLHIANKIYLHSSYTLMSSFKDIVQKKFRSEIELVNFKESVRAAETINDWVENKTLNKIKDLFRPDSFDIDTRAVLVNAIYFKGDWLDKFDPSKTRDEKFYLNDTDTVDCQMMCRTSKYLINNYNEDLDAQLLEIPYKNKDLSLIVILPDKRNGIADLEAKLSNVDLTKITDKMFKSKVDLQLPKFRIETTIDFKDALAKLGLGIIFDEKADFSDIIESSEEPLCISKVVQKTFIEVNEQGVKAAAATGSILRLVKGEPCLEFIANHPFVVLLQIRLGNGNSIILFKGRLSNPTN